MLRTAKVFKTGRSQAVRLPKEFRFDVSEVFIRKDERTGEVILSTKSSADEAWKKLLQDLSDLSDEERSLFPERNVMVAKRRDPVF
jgi:antitoxin VapB